MTSLAWPALLLLATAAPAGQAAPSDAARERLRKAREEVARDQQADLERDARWEKALREFSSASPQRLKLGDGLAIDGVKVASYSSGRLKFAWSAGEVEYPLLLLPHETRNTLLQALVDRLPPADQFEIGRLHVRGNDYERAAECFRRAAAADPALAPLQPDLERLRRLGRLFEGSFRLFGSQLSLQWPFKREAELQDLLPSQDAKLSLDPQGGLTLAGDERGSFEVKEIPFRERVRVSVSLKESESAGHYVGLLFRRPDGAEVAIYGLIATSDKSFFVRRREDGIAADLVPPAFYPGGTRVELLFNRGRFTFRIGDRVMWSGEEGGFYEVTVLLGGIPLGDRFGKKFSVGFKDLSVSGTVSPAWIGKRTAEFREALSFELAREHRVTGTGTATPAGPPGLSVDLRIADPKIRSDYRAAVAAAWPYLQNGDPAAYASAAARLDHLTKSHPQLAAAWYWRGAVEKDAGNLDAATKSFDRALSLEKEFPEAACRKAELLVWSRREEEARALVAQALLAKPDLAEVHLLQSRLDFGAGRSSEALESAAVARKLAPPGDPCAVRAQLLSNAIRGPAWSRPSKTETAHYLVRSDLDAAKVRAYAEHLEAMRPVYQELLGAPATAGSGRAELLIFSSAEGYHNHRDLAFGGRGENSLGVFSPWTGQMLFYDDPEDDEKVQVMAHEGFHQYAATIIPGLPVWFNEGMAEYAGAARVVKGKPAEVGGLQWGRLLDLRWGWKYGWTPLSLERLMTEPRAAFYGQDPSYKYAQAWSVIHYLLHGGRAGGRELLKAYTARLSTGDSAAEAFQTVFAKTDLKALERGWARYVDHLGHASPPPGTPEPVDLLAAVDPVKDAVKGAWTAAPSGGISSDKQPFSRLELPYRPPEEYDFRTAFTRTEGNGDVVLILSKSGRPFAWRLGAADNSQSLISDVRRGAGENPTILKRARWLENGKRHLAVVQVRKDGIRAFLDGRLLHPWKTDGKDLVLPDSLKLPREGHLGLATWESRTTFEYAEVMEISGKGTAAVAAADDPRKAAFAEARVDLLSLIDPKRDAARGDWKRTAEGLASDTTRAARIEIPYRPPDEYDLRLSFTRVSGNEDVGAMLTRKSIPVLWKMGAYANTICGLDQIRGRDANANPTMARVRLENGRRHSSLVQVRKDGIKAFLDGKLLSQWRTPDFKDFTLHPVAKTIDGSLLGLYTWESPAVFHEVELTEISGKGSAPAWATKATEPSTDPVDLLKLIDPKEDLEGTGWRLSGGKLLAPLATNPLRLSQFQIPYLPPLEYDLKMVAEQRGAPGSLDVGLLGRGSCFSVVLESLGSRETFIWGVDRRLAAEAHPGRFQKRWFGDKPRTIVFSMRQTSLGLTVDGKPLFEWQGDVARLHADYGMGDARALFLATWGSYVIHEMVLTPVSGAGRKGRGN